MRRILLRVRTLNNAKPYFFFNEMNKKVLPAIYSTAFWCLLVVLLFFWLYCITTVTPFIGDHSNIFLIQSLLCFQRSPVTRHRRVAHGMEITLHPSLVT